LLPFSDCKLDGVAGAARDKGEEIREIRIDAIDQTSDLPIFAKGEVFRDCFELVWIAEVRKYRIKTARIARKCPTHVDELRRMFRPLDFKGEVFRDLCGWIGCALFRRESRFR
jgi:hypothetical protein